MYEQVLEEPHTQNTPRAASTRDSAGSRPRSSIVDIEMGTQSMVEFHVRF